MTNFSLENGAISVILSGETAAKPGDLVEFYADDDLVSTGSVERRPAGGLVCSALLDHAPAISFPAAIRALLVRLGEELLPGLTIANAAELQSQMGRPGLEVQLSTVQDMAIGFDVNVTCLPVFPRSLTLSLDGQAPITARSEVPPHGGRPESLVHRVVFPVQTVIRDGTAAEMTDDATGSVVFSATLTWMNLIHPVLAELRLMRQQHESLMARLSLMQQQMEARSDPGRERLLLQRLDLTYLLLNERLDRELKWLCKRVDAVGGEKLAVEHLTEVKPPIVSISAGGLQGVGLYDPESNGTATWRWFGRTVTLFFTRVAAGARTLRFIFTAPRPHLDLTKMSVVVNGYDASFEWRYPVGRAELLVSISSIASRPDQTIILVVDFGQGVIPKNENRTLTFACTRLEIES